MLQILPPHNGHLSTRATFFRPQGGPLWRGSTEHYIQMYKILMYSFPRREENSSSRNSNRQERRKQKEKNLEVIHVHVAVQQYSEQCVFKYMNSNEGLKYEIYPRYCFVHCCNHLPEKVQSTCRLISYYPIHSVSHPEIKKKELELGFGK